MTIDLRELFDTTGDSELFDKAMIELLSALNNGQTNDFDYLKLKHSYKALVAMGMDANTATKSAFLTAKTMGLTKEKLLKNVQHYKTVLNKEKEKFALALKNQIANNVDGKVLQISKYNDKITENQNKIKQLQEDIVTMEAEIVQIEKGLDSTKKKIEDTRDQFKSAFDKLYQEIEADGELFNSIL
ncbi:MAG: hypothetical protein J5I52_03830 [Saprospiraceae bacterium]|nr:MAG: hypothetical protein UZ09_BCD002002573 [Bacteroidetes bacterium OLB9]MCO6463258.1 hypothetical protein [Saprospiraceae bacterium]MCZ2337287.1 DUF724 domain-containing protein [Chitinophagales bacterium]